MAFYTPESAEKRREMLKEVGLTPEDLFAPIPEKLRCKAEGYEHLLDEGLNEEEVVEVMSAFADANETTNSYDSYLGAGFYERYQPSMINHIISRQEFLTAYTPYQQEISQGTLRAIFEWQTFICRLTGMEVANSSMYDGASACAEAMLMALREKKRTEKVFVGGGVNPEYRETVKTYLHANGFETVVGEVNEEGVSIYPEDEGYAAFLVQSPNYFGILEDMKEVAEKAHKVGALAVSACDPIALTLLATPGECGIDIAVGEGQSLGLPLNYGGPALGYMACNKKLVRKMPGRICGETIDRDGKFAYVLTLQAREQHIRRDKATSNICTSQALMATAATIYMAMLGKSGMNEVASQSAAKALYLHDALLKTGVFEDVYTGVFFNEFVLKTKDGICVKTLCDALLEKKIIAGVPLSDNRLLIAVTEKKDKKAMDAYAEAVKEVAASIAGKEGGQK